MCSCVEERSSEFAASFEEVKRVADRIARDEKAVREGCPRSRDGNTIYCYFGGGAMARFPW